MAQGNVAHATFIWPGVHHAHHPSSLCRFGDCLVAVARRIAVFPAPGENDIFRARRSIMPRVNPKVELHPWRAVAFFAGCCGGILILFVPPLLAMVIWPSRYELKPAALDERWIGTSTIGDASVEVRRYRDAGEAKSVWKAVSASVPGASSSDNMIHITYYELDNGRRGRVMLIDHVVLRVEAATDDSIENVTAGLPFVIVHWHPDAELNKWPGILFSFIGIYTLVYGVGMFRGGSWAARLSPRPGIAAVSVGELRGRLLAINEMDAPFLIREAKRETLVAEWRVVDARWSTVLQQGGLSFVYRLTMKLDPEAHVVRCVDFMKKAHWSRGVFRSGLSFSFFRGIMFYEGELADEFGLVFQDGQWKVGSLYRYNYSIYEIKAPIVQAVLDSGWTYKPVVTFFRWLGG
jgi:hypothetical protein